jgi:hypothetical protein
MKIKGSVQIWAVNDSGILTDYREIENLIFDVSRPYLFFNIVGLLPVLTGTGTMSIYLSSGVCVDQSSFEDIMNGTAWNPDTPLVIGDRGLAIAGVSYETVSFMEHERVILSTLAFPSVDNSNIINSLGIGFEIEQSSPRLKMYYPVTCASVSPPIAHTIETTVFVHYILDVSIEDEPYMFGREVIRRTPTSSLPYFGTSPSYINWNFYVGMPFYKKQFYVANVMGYPPTSYMVVGGYANYVYVFPDQLASSEYPFPVVSNTRSQCKWGQFIIPQASVGPYGGVYEGRNSSLGVSLISESHISRIFQHLESVTSSLFNSALETDVPEGEGAITLDLSSIDLEDPTAYKIRIISSGDVGESEYKVVTYLGTSSNTLGLGALYRSTHAMGNYNYPPRTQASNMYVSQNREWSAHRLSNTYLIGVGEEYLPPTYLYIRYKEGVRFVLNNIYDNYAIQSDGICYVSYTASPTSVYSIDGNDEKPGYVTETLEFDLASVFPSQGITSIRGITLDEDMGYIWVATNNCFVRVDTSVSGGGFEIFDHNTPLFGEYCSADSVVLYTAFNGRFQAENGTLTWVPNNAQGSVFHWTGDRAARVCASGGNYVYNLMQDLSLGYICISKDRYPQVLRIGDAVEGLVIAYTSILPVGNLDYQHEAFSMCVDDGFFFFASPSPSTYSSSGYNPAAGRGMKGQIDLTTFVETREACISQPFTCSGRHTPNRSLVRGCLSISLDQGHWAVLSLGQEYGWDGASWVLGYVDGKPTHVDSQELPGGVGISFSDIGIFDSFKSGEYFSFGVNPHGLYKDNLENLTMYGCYYSGKAIVEERIITVPLGTYEITEKTDPNFLAMNGWKYCSHSRVFLVDEFDVPYGDPLEIVEVAPATANQVQFTDLGDIVFHASMEDSRVKIRYVWVTNK